jgi:hypothetical protein
VDLRLCFTPLSPCFFRQRLGKIVKETDMQPAKSERQITVDGLTLELRETPQGPILKGGTPLTEPLAWVLNTAFNGEIPSLRDALKRGDNAGRGGIFLIRPLPEHDVQAERMNWQALAGRDPGNDVYLLGTNFLEITLLAPRQALIDILDTLAKMRGAMSPPLPSLFCEEPLWEVPAQGEHLLVADLERQLVEFEELEQRAATDDERAELSAKRRFLLLDFNAGGLLNNKHGTAKSVWLEKWGFQAVHRFYQAVLQLTEYFGSEERREFIPEAGVEPVLGADISVDWFRREQKPPAGIPQFRWLAFCEEVFRSGEVGDVAAGEIFTKIDEGWVLINWRRDDGTTPAIYDAHMVKQ